MNPNEDKKGKGMNLKSCPFCQRKPIVEKKFWTKDFRIKCDNFLCFVKPKTIWCQFTAQACMLIWNDRMKR